MEAEMKHTMEAERDADRFVIAVEDDGQLHVDLSVKWNSKSAASRDLAHRRLSVFTGFIQGTSTLEDLMDAWKRQP
jgi:hypothetical protein